MADEDAQTSLSLSPTLQSGTNWNTFFRQFDATVGRNYESGAGHRNEYVSKMPHQKATCFGVSPLDNARYLRLVKCNLCNRVISRVGYYHHIRRRHFCQAPELNCYGSGDEAPDFLLSPPHYATSGRSSPIKPTNPMAYKSEQRGLLLVLKRTKVTNGNPILEPATNSKETSVERLQSEVPEKSQQNGRSSSRARRRAPGRLLRSSGGGAVDSDCVALRTRKRQPETQYVELPAVTRQSKSSASPSKRGESAVEPELKDSGDSGVGSRQLSPDSSPSIVKNHTLQRPAIFVVDEDAEDWVSTSLLDNPSEVGSPAIQLGCLPSPLLQSTGHSLDGPPSSQLSSSTHCSVIPASKSSDLSAVDETLLAPPISFENFVAETIPKSANYLPVDEDVEGEEEDESDRSISPEMPQLERQDIYEPIDDSSDGIEMSGGYEVAQTSNGTTSVQFVPPPSTTVVYLSGFTVPPFKTLRFDRLRGWISVNVPVDVSEKR